MLRACVVFVTLTERAIDKYDLNESAYAQRVDVCLFFFLFERKWGVFFLHGVPLFTLRKCGRRHSRSACTKHRDVSPSNTTHTHTHTTQQTLTADCFSVRPISSHQCLRKQTRAINTDTRKQTWRRCSCCVSLDVNVCGCDVGDAGEEVYGENPLEDSSCFLQALSKFAPHLSPWSNFRKEMGARAGEGGSKTTHTHTHTHTMICTFNLHLSGLAFFSLSLLWGSAHYLSHHHHSTEQHTHTHTHRLSLSRSPAPREKSRAFPNALTTFRTQRHARKPCSRT